MAKQSYVIRFTGVDIKPSDDFEDAKRGVDDGSSPSDEYKLTVATEDLKDVSVVILLVDHLAGKLHVFDQKKRMETQQDTGTSSTSGGTSATIIIPDQPLKGVGGEIMVFAEGYRPGVVAFDADMPSKEMNVVLKKSQPIDVCVWLLCGDPLSGQDTGSVARQRMRALRHIAFANAVLRAEHAGFYLRVARESDIIDVAEEVKSKCPKLADRFSWGSIALLNEQVSLLTDSNNKRCRYRNGVVNILYTDNIGRQWGDGQTGTDEFAKEGMIVLGNRAMDDLLLHELGHLCGLGHTDEAPIAGTPGISSDNWMHGRSFDRKTITGGQLARMHFGLSSTLNTLYDFNPIVNRRTCLDTMYSPHCVALNQANPHNDDPINPTPAGQPEGTKSDDQSGSPALSLFSSCAYSPIIVDAASMASDGENPVDEITARQLIRVLKDRPAKIIAELKQGIDDAQPIWPDTGDVTKLIATLGDDPSDSYVRTEAQRFGVNYDLLAEKGKLPLGKQQFYETFVGLLSTDSLSASVEQSSAKRDVERKNPSGTTKRPVKKDDGGTSGAAG